MVGDPRAKDTEMGPLVSKSHRDSVASYVPDDAPVAFRGSAPSGPGYWFPPTVLIAAAVRPHRHEEIFGPVVTVLPFDDEADAIALANDTEYGLSGSIWTDICRGRCGCPARWRRAICRSTRTRRCATTPRSGASSSPGWAANSAPDAPVSFTDVKNVFISTDR